MNSSPVESNRRFPRVVNGFHGSGKTTHFRKLLVQAHKRKLDVRAIVNDMSELDIDGELIGNTGIIEANASLLRSISSVVLSSEKGIAMLTNLNLQAALTLFTVNLKRITNLIM